MRNLIIGVFKLVLGGLILFNLLMRGGPKGAGTHGVDQLKLIGGIAAILVGVFFLVKGIIDISQVPETPRRHRKRDRVSTKPRAVPPELPPLALVETITADRPAPAHDDDILTVEPASPVKGTTGQDSPRPERRKRERPYPQARPAGSSSAVSPIVILVAIALIIGLAVCGVIIWVVVYN